MDAKNLKELSDSNRDHLSKFIELIKDQIDLTGVNSHYRSVAIPYDTLEKNNISKTEASNLCSSINNLVRTDILGNQLEREIERIVNVDAQQLGIPKDFFLKDILPLVGLTPSDAGKYLILEFLYTDSLDRLNELYKRIKVSKKVEEKNTETHISYNIKIGRLTFNDNRTVQFEGKQKDVADCLVEKGKDTPVSWDEIYEQFKDLAEKQDVPNGSEIGLQKKSVRTAVTAINIKTEKYLKPDKVLIDAKNNEYWLQYEVGKDG